MAHRPGFTMILDTPETLAACDICTQFCPIGETRVRTFIGGTPQSDVCMDCATAIKRLKRALPIVDTLALVEA